MKKHMAFAMTIAAALVFVSTSGLAPAQASQDPRNTVIESINLDQADVRDALKVLFKDVKAQYTVAPDVQGVVTVSLNRVPFETALRNILNQVDSTWAVDAGIYTIIKKPVAEAPQAIEAPVRESSFSVPITIPLRSIDPARLLQLLQGQDNVLGSPEISPLAGLGGGGFGGIGGGNIGGGGFGGGNFGGGGFGGGGIGGGGFGGGGVGGGGGGLGGGGGNF